MYRSPFAASDWHFCAKNNFKTRWFFFNFKNRSLKSVRKERFRLVILYRKDRNFLHFSLTSRITLIADTVIRFRTFTRKKVCLSWIMYSFYIVLIIFLNFWFEVKVNKTTSATKVTEIVPWLISQQPNYIGMIFCECHFPFRITACGNPSLIKQKLL